MNYECAIVSSHAKQQVIIIRSSAVMVTSEPWRTVLLTCWLAHGYALHTEVAPGASPELVQSASCALLCLGWSGVLFCRVCCAGLDLTKLLGSYSKRARQHIAAGRDATCIVCTLVRDKL